MKIIIPMTGYGSRFIAAGYRELKPFINVFDKPILEWIVKKIYPTEKNFIFIIKKEDTIKYPDIEKRIKLICPTGEIFIINDWQKKGPVYDVLCASELIDNEIPVIINYCDFYQTWDWQQFKLDVIQRNCDGCVPCYTGFHPHLIPSKNLYASCLVDEHQNLLEIREKYSFTSDKKMGLHSPGTYYFKSGKLLKKYCQRLVNSGLQINGEYYASLPFNEMVNDGLKVWVPSNIQYFCQWGTPEDMNDFLFWTEMVKGFE